MPSFYPLSLEEITLFLQGTVPFNNALISPEELKELAASFEVIHLQGGDTLIHQGTVEDSLYLIVQGRLKVYQHHKQGQGNRFIAELGPQEFVGEMALLAQRPRSATIRAIRDTLLLKLSQEHFSLLAKQHHDLFMHFVQIALSRLNTGHQKQSTPRTIALVPSSYNPHFKTFTNLLRKAFIEHLPPSQVIHLSSKEPNKTPYFLNELEKHYRYLLYETDPELSDWTRLSLRQADLVLFIGFAQSSPSLNEIEQFFFQNIKKHTQTVKLILLHEHSSTVPIHTESWTQLRSHLLHEHIRLSSSADLIKLIRSITYQSIGLVLSGGGARGLAHIGVLKALEELKIPIDCIGGSSMGALIAGAYASGMDINTMIKEVEDTLLPAIRSLDYTFPLLALKSGKSISLALRKTFGTERNIQDCWTRFFCVSTNLSKFHLQVHHQGILWESIRASLSIPALFPPVTTSKGELLVDGGLVNNMPVDIMKQQIQEGIVLAISTNSRKDPISSPPLEMWVSGWKLLLKKLSSMNSSPSTPHLGELMMEIILLSGSEHQMRMQEEADHCLHLELSSFNLLQFKAFEKIIDIGYQEAIKYFSFLSFPLSK